MTNSVDVSPFFFWNAPTRPGLQPLHLVAVKTFLLQWFTARFASFRFHQMIKQCFIAFKIHMTSSTDVLHMLAIEVLSALFSTKTKSKAF